MFQYSSGILSIGTQLANEHLQPLPPDCERVQVFHVKFSDEEFQRLAGFLKNYPNVTFRVAGHGAYPDLEFLKHFPFIRKFIIDDFFIRDISAMSHLPSELEILGIGETKSKSISLAPLARFKKLRELYIHNKPMLPDVAGQLQNLEALSLTSYSLHDLSFLTGLRRLWSLRIALGSVKDIRHLPEVGRLKYLEIWRARGVADLSPVSRIKTLQFLFLQDLPHVNRLPALELTGLRRIHIQNLKCLRDLSPLRVVKTLEELVVLQSPHMMPEDFSCLVRHPSLKRVLGLTGSVKKNKTIAEMFDLPAADYSAPDYQYV